MEEITLEKIDIIKERTGVTYTEAKEALEASNGNVIDALVYVEKNSKKNGGAKEQFDTTKDEFVAWIKDIISKGNVSRIRVKKDDKIILDIPVSAGIVGGVAAGVVWAPSIALMFLTAVVTRVTVEITKEDGSVEVVNKVVKDTVTNVKEKMNDAASEFKEKFKGSNNNRDDSENSYQYTVRFDDIDDDKKSDDNETK
ncbi:DUF4342 domain-containing protein [Clostridium guangxiense]|uniref:DUF4342 domain-containing protein n=1 Tax=Clostridium guangxiense TaxID=1662055 RepID=UPI001E45D605|nr:DUF4342 domain-containing protein [Clostridium guangxiense]MCD2347511.1 DUF4342 domain-containing protein [Clostridium guangxiense]